MVIKQFPSQGKDLTKTLFSKPINDWFIFNYQLNGGEI